MRPIKLFLSKIIISSYQSNHLIWYIKSGKCLEIWWKYYTTLYFIKNKKGSMNPVLIKCLSLVFTFHFALFLTTTWKRCDVNPYPWDWKVPWLNGCLMVSVVWKIMILSTSLSGKNMSFLSWDSGKIVSILRYCLEIWLSKGHTNPVHVAN